MHSDLLVLSGRELNASSLHVAVLGGGSFGTAMACVLGRKGIHVKLIVRKPDVVEAINDRHVNPYYQKEIVLPPTVRATLDAEEALEGADFFFHAVPVQFSREALGKVVDLMPDDLPVISLSKGIETSTLMLMNDVIVDCLGGELCAPRKLWRYSP